MVVPVLLLTLGAAAVLFGTRRRHPRRDLAMAQGQASPVAYQHLQLYQGGQVTQHAIDVARTEIENQFAQGGIAAVEAEIAPGLDYVVKVRALADIGSEDAARVLERQLKRRITQDPIDQTWYWIDLSQALRSLNRDDCLPILFRCGERAMETSLGYLFAAEVTAFPNFAECLHDPLSPTGQTALRLLRTALEGVRRGFVPVTLYSDAQIGEMLRHLAEDCPDTADPLLTRVFIETLRHARRSYSSSPELRDDPGRRQAIRWQVGHLRDAESIIREYLHGIAEDLATSLPRHGEAEQQDILAVVAEMRADVGPALVDLLAEANFKPRAAALECLQWSQTPEAAWVLCGQGQSIGAGTIGKSTWWKRPIAEQVPAPELLSSLKALRGHPGEEAEAVLREFARHPQPTFRIAAIKSLGWWEPIDRVNVIHSLHSARIDSLPEVRMAAVAALARLGECASLNVLREALQSPSVDNVHQTIDLIAAEGLTWLWPDLDLLTESDNPAIAHHAWEAVEDLRELILGPMA